MAGMKERKKREVGRVHNSDIIGSAINAPCVSPEKPAVMQ